MRKKDEVSKTQGMTAEKNCGGEGIEFYYISRIIVFKKSESVSGDKGAIRIWGGHKVSAEGEWGPD